MIQPSGSSLCYCRREHSFHQERSSFGVTPHDPPAFSCFPLPPDSPTCLPPPTQTPPEDSPDSRKNLGTCVEGEMPFLTGVVEHRTGEALNAVSQEQCGLSRHIRNVTNLWWVHSGTQLSAAQSSGRRNSWPFTSLCPQGRKNITRPNKACTRPKNNTDFESSKEWQPKK